MVGTAQEAYQDTEVWRFTVESKGQYYVLYFIALPKVMRKNESNILQILESFTIVKAWSKIYTLPAYGYAISKFSKLFWVYNG